MNKKPEKLSIKKNYEILEKISEGNFGTVFKAQHKKTGKFLKFSKLLVKLGQIFAIKKIFSSSSNKKSRNMVEREIRILSGLSHENVLYFFKKKNNFKHRLSKFLATK